MRILLAQAQQTKTRIGLTTGGNALHATERSAHWGSMSALRSTGAVADHVESAAEAIEYLQTYEYDIMVLDQTLADMDGIEALRRMRAQRIATPILLLTNAACGQTNAAALRAGADDLLAKPYHDEELAARVEAVVRRRNGYSRSVLQVGPLQIDMASREVTVDGQPISVTRKEFAILELMVLRRGRVITKQNFLDHLYDGFDGPETRVIDVFICNLRKKLAHLGLGTLIDTVRGHGYILRDIPDVAAQILPLPMLAEARVA